MLIRLMSDGKNNSEHADKLIAIDGLPEEWIFDRRKDIDQSGNPDERLFLKDPWEVDVTENIPVDIRFKFQQEPITVWFESPMEIRPGTIQTSAKMEFVTFFKKAHGFRLNMQTNGGKQMWDQIYDLMDRETPRSQRIPEAAVVGNKIQWLLKVENVPHVKLTGSEIEIPKEQVVVIQPKPTPRPNEYPCRTCGDIFDKDRGRWMHERRKHGVKESFVPEKVRVPA